MPPSGWPRPRPSASAVPTRNPITPSLPSRNFWTTSGCSASTASASAPSAPVSETWRRPRRSTAASTCLPRGERGLQRLLRACVRHVARRDQLHDVGHVPRGERSLVPRGVAERPPRLRSSSSRRPWGRRTARTVSSKNAGDSVRRRRPAPPSRGSRPYLSSNRPRRAAGSSGSAARISSTQRGGLDAAGRAPGSSGSRARTPSSASTRVRHGPRPSGASPARSARRRRAPRLPPISYASARSSDRNEFRFLISTFVPTSVPRRSQRDVGVAAQRALLHVAVAHAEGSRIARSSRR